eukprot:s315_g11.t1
MGEPRMLRSIIPVCFLIEYYGNGPGSDSVGQLENCEKPGDDQQGSSAAPPATVATADCESAGLQKDDKMSL